MGFGLCERRGRKETRSYFIAARSRKREKIIQTDEIVQFWKLVQIFFVDFCVQIKNQKLKKSKKKKHPKRKEKKKKKRKESGTKTDSRYTIPTTKCVTINK